MRPIKVAICDDNPEERAFYYSMCKTLKERKGVQIRLKEYEHGEALLFDLEDIRNLNSVDIILLDIHMPGKNGIDIAAKLREYGFQGAIIFVTKSQNHWRNAFSVKAFNYITKDNDLKERLLTVFWSALLEAKARRGQTLLFSSVSETRQIEVDTIQYFKVEQHLVTVFYQQTNFQFVSSLAKIETLLYGNEDFIRVHRSYLVSVPHIASYGDEGLVMRNGDKIPVSRNCISPLKSALAERGV